MLALTGLDYIIIGILTFFGFIGLIRGFLKEVASILNWGLTIYLTSLLKPYCMEMFKDKIKIPFLLDCIVNSVLFVILVIIISIITKKLVLLCKHFINKEIDFILGLLSGCLKGYLISLLILSTILIVNEDKKLSFFENSVGYNLLLDNKRHPSVRMLKVLLGDFVVKKSNNIEKTKEELEKTIGKKIKKEAEEKLENTKDDIMDELKDINFDELDFNDIKNLEKILK